MKCGVNVEKPNNRISGKYCAAGGPRNVNCTNNARQRAYRFTCFLGRTQFAKIGSFHAKTSSRLAAIENIRGKFKISMQIVNNSLDLKDV